MTSPHGFTLLEVILAIGILAAALAVVGEVTHLSFLNAEAAAMEGDALLIGESVMAQVVAGLIAPAELPATPWNSEPEEPTWQYSISVSPTEMEDLLVVTVQVEQIASEDGAAIAVELVNWIADPASLDSASSSGGSL